MVGTVSTSDSNLAVATPNAGTVTEPTATVSQLRSETEQAPDDRAQHPGLLQGWQGGVMPGSR